MKNKLLLPVLFGAASLSASASIIVQTSTAQFLSTSDSLSFSVNNVADSILVIGIAGGNYNTAGAPTFTIDGSSAGITNQAFAQAIDVSDSNKYDSFAAIYTYTLSPSQLGTTVTIADATPNASAFSVVQLSGVTSPVFHFGASSADGVTTTTVNLNGSPLADNFVFSVAGFGANSGTLALSGTTLDPTDSNVVSRVTAYGWDEDLSLSPSDDFIWTRSGNDNDISAAVLAVSVPEPSTYALGFGILALGVVMLRRRLRA